MKKDDKIAIITGILAVIIGLYCIIYLPQDRVVRNLGIFLLKILPFALGAICISYLNTKFIYKFKLVFPSLFIGFLVIFCVFVPKIFFYLDDYYTVYYLTLIEIPFLILLLTYTFRLGGGSTSNCLRLAFSLLLIMQSGIEDLAFLKINPHTDPQWATIPDVWTWASHIAVIIGHYPTKYEAYAFIGISLALAIFIAFFPKKRRNLTDEGFISKN
jgi:hypothetical protein